LKTKKWCKNCYKSYEATRADSEFCSGKCCAKWYRDNETTEAAFHAARERHHVYNCEYCGDEFWINDYGVRGGKRAPRFCSTKCRVASHRADHAEMGHQEGWKDANTNRQTPPKGSKGQTWDDFTRDQKKRAEEYDRQWKAYQDAEEKRKKQREEQEEQARKRRKQSHYTQESSWTVLGVPVGASIDECRRAWRKLVNQYHPDRCKDPDALQKTQQINSAWDDVKKYWDAKKA